MASSGVSRYLSRLIMVECGANMQLSGRYLLLNP